MDGFQNPTEARLHNIDAQRVYSVFTAKIGSPYAAGLRDNLWHDATKKHAHPHKADGIGPNIPARLGNHGFLLTGYRRRP
jgi:hypothetical protein